MRWPWVARRALEAAAQARDLCASRNADLTASVDRMAAERDQAERKTDEWRNRAHELAMIADGHKAEANQLRALLEQSQGFLRDYSVQIQALTKVMVDLKREGFTSPVNPADITTDAPLPNAVEEAITQRAAEGTELYRALQKYARAALRRDGATDETVAQEIIKGASEEVFELL